METLASATRSFLLVRLAAPAPHLGAGECAGVLCRHWPVAAPTARWTKFGGRQDDCLGDFQVEGSFTSSLPCSRERRIEFMVAMPQFASSHRHAARTDVEQGAPGLPRTEPFTTSKLAASGVHLQDRQTPRGSFGLPCRSGRPIPLPG